MKRLFLCFFVILFIIIASGCETISIDLSSKDVISLYKKAPEKFINVADYIIQNDVSIDRNQEGKYSISSSRKNIPVVDKNVSKNIQFIIEDLQFEHIIIDGNFVSFIRESTFGNCHGIAYSIDGKEPVSDVYKTTTESISDNWYYFRERETD